MCSAEIYIVPGCVYYTTLLNSGTRTSDIHIPSRIFAKIKKKNKD